MSQASENPQARTSSDPSTPQNQIINDLAPTEEVPATLGIVNDLAGRNTGTSYEPERTPSPAKTNEPESPAESALPTPGIINDLRPQEPEPASSAPSEQPSPTSSTPASMPSSYLDPGLVNDLAPQETSQRASPQPKTPQVDPQPIPQPASPQQKPPQQSPQPVPSPATHPAQAPKVSTKKPISPTATPPRTQQSAKPQTSAPKVTTKKPIGDAETETPTKGRKLVKKPSAPLPAQETPTSTDTPEPSQENLLWKGNYSGRCLIPSFLACAVLTSGAVWVCFQVVPADLFPWTLVGLIGAIWSLQLIRWSYRVLGYRYGMTSRRIYESRGWLYGKEKEIPLPHIAKVRVQRNLVEYFFGVGKIIVEPTPAGGQELLILESVISPKAVVDQFEKCVASIKPD
ncbi:MAG: PH domain-containing protein [Gemmataceae bacterium]